MRIKTTSILIGLLLVTAAFLLAQALSPNTGADRSGSPGKSSSRDGGTSATENLRSSNSRKSAEGLRLCGENPEWVCGLESWSCNNDRKPDVQGGEGPQERSLRERRHGEALAPGSTKRRTCASRLIIQINEAI